jgi:alpha-glucosidase
MAMILLTSFGTPIIYYGEEIGMASEKVNRKELKDKIGLKYWPFYAGRDKLRKPMQWDQSHNAGFSKSTPWLPINKPTSKTNLSSQLKDKNSIYNLFRQLIMFRKNNEILQKGSWKLFHFKNKNILAYKRVFKDKELIIVLNFSKKKQKVQLPSLSIVFSTHQNTNNNFLYPFEGRILKM